MMRHLRKKCKPTGAFRDRDRDLRKGGGGIDPGGCSSRGRLFVGPGEPPRKKKKGGGGSVKGHLPSLGRDQEPSTDKKKSVAVRRGEVGHRP